MITENSRVRLRRPTVAVLVMGQSNEQGPLPRTRFATYPLCFQSAINPAVVVPFTETAQANRGGWWPYVYDALWAWGYDLKIVNAAVGGISLLTHLCGFAQTRANSTIYRQARVGEYPDRGDYGDVVQFSSKTFRVTAGAKRAAFGGPPLPNPVGTSGYQDFVAFSGSETSAGTAPDVSATAIGGTVTDGSLTLTRIDDRFVSEGTFYPGPIAPTENGGFPNYNLGGVLGERNAGFGFDPLGIIARAWELASRVQAERKIVYFSQGQSDLGTGAVTYGRAVTIAMNFFLMRGWEVIIGNTCYSPAASGATTGNYDSHVTGATTAISTLETYYPDKVHAGANLYGSMGTTGPMGGQRFTGAQSGTTLTVSALLSGSGLAAGQTLWNGETAVATILSQLTGAPGGTGTYQMSASATIGSTTLIAAGEFLQFDGVHLSGAGLVGPAVSGVQPAGKLVADSFKAVLPQLVT
jgi:hypothetical protein